MKTSQELIQSLTNLIYHPAGSETTQVDEMKKLQVEIRTSCKTYLACGVLIGALVSLLICVIF